MLLSLSVYVIFFSIKLALLPPSVYVISSRIIACCHILSRNLEHSSSSHEKQHYTKFTLQFLFIYFSCSFFIAIRIEKRKNRKQTTAKMNNINWVFHFFTNLTCY